LSFDMSGIILPARPDQLPDTDKRQSKLAALSFL